MYQNNFIEWITTREKLNIFLRRDPGLLAQQNVTRYNVQGSHSKRQEMEMEFWENAVCNWIRVCHLTQHRERSTSPDQKVELLHKWLKVIEEK